MVKIIKVDRDQLRRDRQAELDKLGMTWEQVSECVRDCGCCLELPREFEHLNEQYVEDVWKNYKFWDLDNDTL